MVLDEFGFAEFAFLPYSIMVRAMDRQTDRLLMIG